MIGPPDGRHVLLPRWVPSSDELALAVLVEDARPQPLRRYDQIPMRATDLLRQVWAMAPILAGRSVAFLGDSDCASLLLGKAAGQRGLAPAAITLLDFDKRLLASARAFADRHNFGDLLSTEPYNVL